MSFFAIARAAAPFVARSMTATRFVPNPLAVKTQKLAFSNGPFGKYYEFPPQLFLINRLRVHPLMEHDHQCLLSLVARLQGRTVTETELRGIILAEVIRQELRIEDIPKVVNLYGLVLLKCVN